MKKILQRKLTPSDVTMRGERAPRTFRGLLNRSRTAGADAPDLLAGCCAANDGQHASEDKHEGGCREYLGVCEVEHAQAVAGDCECLDADTRYDEPESSADVGSRLLLLIVRLISHIDLRHMTPTSSEEIYHPPSCRMQRRNSAKAATAPMTIASTNFRSPQ